MLFATFFPIVTLSSAHFRTLPTQEGGKTTLWGRYKETIACYHLNMQRLAEVLTHQREGSNNIPEGSIFLATAVGGCVQRLQRPNHNDELLRPAQRFWSQAMCVSVEFELQLTSQAN